MDAKKRILIVEDDLTFSLMLSTWLKKKGYQVANVASVAQAKKKFEEVSPDFILSDLRLPDEDGIEFLAWVKEQNHNVPFIIMTNYAQIHIAVEAMKLGANDFIEKPIQPDLLLKKLSELTEPTTTPLQAKTVVLPEEDETSNRDYVEGRCPKAVLLYQHLNLVAPTNMSVLILGSSGTGKENVARKLHDKSKRSDGPFIAVDCGAIPKELAASEFFGHVKGSFTGAFEDKKGAFELANGGTLFLDEIGNLPYDLQVQLLRAVQERVIRPVGSAKNISIDVRLVSATNDNLRESIETGDFREDLYHRVNEFSLEIPDLKDREEDIMIFANYFLEKAKQELAKENIIGFDNNVIRFFESYSWPGNLREMKNVIRYATLVSTDSLIKMINLPAEVNVARESQESLQLSSLKDNEMDSIDRALNATSGNKSAAAKLLGIDRKTLYNKLKARETNK